MIRLATFAFIVLIFGLSPAVSADPIEDPKCFDAWSEKIYVWTEKNGPINGDLTEVRSTIARDEKTEFSKIVRSVWKRQRYVNSYYSYQNITLMFEKEALGMVPPGCESAVYAGVAFHYGESPWLFTEHGLEEMRLEAPKRADKDMQYFGNWILVNILLKP